jgi:hypothetical protein
MSAFLTDTPFEKSKAPAVHDIEFQNQQIIGEHDVLACIEGPRPPGSRAAPWVKVSLSVVGESKITKWPMMTACSPRVKAGR